VQANVRFAAILVFQDKQKHRVERTRSALLEAADAVFATWLAVESADPPALGIREKSIEVEAASAGDDVMATFSSLVASDVPAIGPLKLSILTAPQDAGAAVAVVANANHAIMDGRSMRTFLEHVSLCLAGGELLALAKPNRPPCEWSGALRPPDGLEESPAFLPLDASTSGAALTIYEALQLEPRGEAGQDARVEVAHVAAALAAAKAKGATATGLWVACISRAVAEAYLSRVPSAEQCMISISILVDLREHLDPNVATREEVAQALATVCVGCTVQRSSVDARSSDTLLAEAAAATADMRRRIQRGEAHRQAAVMGSGDFEKGQPPATVEFSNLGIFNLQPEDTSASLCFSQRFAGYEGLSILLHTESGNTTMKLLGSLGVGIPSSTAQELLERMKACFESVAAS